MNDSMKDKGMPVKEEGRGFSAEKYQEKNFQKKVGVKKKGRGFFCKKKLPKKFPEKVGRAFLLEIFFG